MISDTRLMQQEARSAGAVLVASAGPFHSPSASAEEESVNVRKEWLNLELVPSRSKTVPPGPVVSRQTVFPHHANYKLENHEEWELEESDWGQIANRHVVEFSASEDEAPLSTLVARQNQPSGVVAGHKQRVVGRRSLVRQGSEGVEIKPVGPCWSPSSHHLGAEQMVTQPANDVRWVKVEVSDGSDE
ncbi:hypothetical protein PtA15_4A704 [Puccinia triticina]|uniref:Uncharacterized protein n=1 Tax=Puccinia triticina TaxID=208348 RepID=A0ABY7CJF2_9BASI|nr:uncharacterized protein PtA15_4A704 [Puccinia triticina]WAQ84251.1 hypothetical protein PtA15_4A704 [Puccinia triticina]